MASGLGPSVASTVVSVVSLTPCVEIVWELGVVSSVLGFCGEGVGLGAGRHRSREIGTMVSLSSTTSTASNTCLIRYGPMAWGRSFDMLIDSFRSCTVRC